MNWYKKAQGICKYYNSLEGICVKGCGYHGVKKGAECPFITQITCKCYISKPEEDVTEAGVNSTMSASPSVPMSEEIGISASPRQIYTRDDVIQNRDDLAPSMLKKRKKKKKK